MQAMRSLTLPVEGYRWIVEIKIRCVGDEHLCQKCLHSDEKTRVDAVWQIYSVSNDDASLTDKIVRNIGYIQTNRRSIVMML